MSGARNRVGDPTTSGVSSGNLFLTNDTKRARDNDARFFSHKNNLSLRLKIIQPIQLGILYKTTIIEAEVTQAKKLGHRFSAEAFSTLWTGFHGKHQPPKSS